MFTYLIRNVIMSGKEVIIFRTENLISSNFIFLSFVGIPRFNINYTHTDKHGNHTNDRLGNPINFSLVTAERK